MKNGLKAIVRATFTGVFACAALSLGTHRVEAALSRGQIEAQIGSTLGYLAEQQATNGSWGGAFISDVTQDATYLAAGRKLGVLTDEKRDSYVANILLRMDPSRTGWTAYPKGPVDPAVTGFTLKALELVGVLRSDPRVVGAWQSYLAAGGDRIQTATLRMQMGILELIPRESVMPPLPPEFLNVSFNVGMRRLGIHGELLYPIFGVSILKRIQDQGWARFADTAEEYQTRPLQIGRTSVYRPLYFRRSRVTLAKEIVAQALQSRGADHAWYGTLFTVSNLILLQEAQRAGLGDFEEAIRLGWQAMDAWRTRSLEGFLAIQPMRSDTWDTAALLTTLSHVPSEFASQIRSVRSDEATTFLMTNRVPTGEGKWGWSFDSRDRMLPDVDDTAAVIHALSKGSARHEEQTRETMRGALRWILERQNRNGGFPAWTKGVSPFLFGLLKVAAKFPDIADVGQADITARVLHMYHEIEGLNLVDQEIIEGSRQKACRFFHEKSKRIANIPVNIFVGHWFTNYGYSAASLIDGLIYGKCDHSEQWIKGLARWLVEIQQADGGWGEDNRSYLTKRYVSGATTVSQSSLILIGLIEAYQQLQTVDPHLARVLRESIERGILFLATRTKNGTDFFEEDFTAILVKGATYSRYELLPAYGSLYVFSRWHKVGGR